MFNSNTIVASLIWGSIGFGFALYGWRQKSPVPLFGGIALIAASYFIPSAIHMSLACVMLIAGIVWLNRRG